MMCVFHALAMLTPGFFRWGGLHIPIYGAFAAAGLTAALWLSQRTARWVQIPAERMWDAGVVAVSAALVFSRALLVMQDPRAFLRYPLLVLSLHSLTYGGLLLTALLTWSYLRWKRLAVLDVLDAWAPCAALLGAALQLGDFAAGADAGMPTSLPWGVTRGAMMVQPVELLGAGGAAVLGCVLLWRLRGREQEGQVAGLALGFGGLMSFLLDMLRQPSGSDAGAWLEPSQWAALAAMLAGVGLCLALPFRAKTDAAEPHRRGTGAMRPQPGKCV